jgi:hypothetical protein
MKGAGINVKLANPAFLCYNPLKFLGTIKTKWHTYSMAKEIDNAARSKSGSESIF